jgi:hypothetical protein
MKTKEEIEELAKQYANQFDNIEDAVYDYTNGYTKCQEGMAKDVEDLWVKYRETTNCEDAWLFKQWLIIQITNKENGN